MALAQVSQQGSVHDPLSQSQARSLSLRNAEGSQTLNSVSKNLLLDRMVGRAQELRMRREGHSSDDDTWELIARL